MSARRDDVLLYGALEDLAEEIASGFSLAIPMDTVDRLLDEGGTASVPECEET